MMIRAPGSIESSTGCSARPRASGRPWAPAAACPFLSGTQSAVHEALWERRCFRVPLSKLTVLAKAELLVAAWTASHRRTSAIDPS